MATEKPTPNFKQELSATRNDLAVNTNSKTPLNLLEPTHQAIREAAYHIYLARGGKPGNAVADWTQAERTLKTARRAPSK